MMKEKIRVKKKPAKWGTIINTTASNAFYEALRDVILYHESKVTRIEEKPQGAFGEIKDGLWRDFG